MFIRDLWNLIINKLLFKLLYFFLNAFLLKVRMLANTDCEHLILKVDECICA